MKRSLQSILFFILALMGNSPAVSACLGPDSFYILRGIIGERWAKSSHPLLGKVLQNGQLWEPDHKETSCGTATALSETLRHLSSVLGYDADVLILGEVHDNAEHHWLRSHFMDHTHGYVAYAERAGQPPRILAAVLEQLNDESAARRYRDLNRPMSREASSDEFKRTVNWDNSAWSKYPYDDLLTILVQRAYALYAGDVPRDVMMKAAKDGPGAIPEDDRKRLKLDVPLGEKLDAASIDEIYDAHCQSMPKEALGGMAFAQRYRDANLADVALKAAEKHGSAIVIAGNGHVRTDRGVPWYIKQRAPDKKVVSVMLIEVEEGKNDPEAYVPRDPDGKPATDFIIFTPKAERSGDPCDKFKPK